jgi:hypothetical protein
MRRLAVLKVTDFSVVTPCTLEENKFRKPYHSHFQEQFVSDTRNLQETGGKKTQKMQKTCSLEM